MNAADRPVYPSYTQLDLNAGIRGTDWTVTLFATNITDRRAVLSIDSLMPTAVFYTQPRTVGMSYSRSF